MHLILITCVSLLLSQCLLDVAGQEGFSHAAGTLAYDTISMGGLKVHNQYFGAVTDVPSNFNADPISGYLGLGFSSIATSQKPTFFENLIIQERIEAPFFSVYLTRGKASGSKVRCATTFI